jgi:hypothetical protein
LLFLRDSCRAHARFSQRASLDVRFDASLARG